MDNHVQMQKLNLAQLLHLRMVCPTSPLFYLRM